MGASIWAPGSTVSLDSAALAVLGASSGSNLIGFIQAGAGAVTRTAQAKMRDIVSVKDFGAVGDGATDDAAAIQAAVAHLTALHGGIAYLPSGQYVTTETLDLRAPYNAGLWPEQLQLSVGLKGNGKHGTYVIPQMTVTCDTVRKAAVIAGGYSQLEDLTLICYGGNTCYYGLVQIDTSWKMEYTNLDIVNFHVPYSSGIIKTYKTTGGSGLEFEPAAGGIAMANPYIQPDLAQFAFKNCRFTARTAEFYDAGPTWDQATRQNANGTALSRGTMLTTDITGAAFTDGSFAVEIGGNKSVNVSFDHCTIECTNVYASGSVRLHEAGNVNFHQTLCSSPVDFVSMPYQSFFYRENIASGGSDVFFNNCYLIGGIASVSTSQGIITIRDCDGEALAGSAGSPAYGIAPNYYVDLFYPLTGTGFGAALHIDGLWLGRGSGTTRMVLSIAAQGTPNAVAPFGNLSLFTQTKRFLLRNIRGISLFLIGHETLLGDSRYLPSVNLHPNIPEALAGRNVNPLYLTPDIYDPSPGGCVAFSNTGQYHGKWFLLADDAVANIFAHMVPINPRNSYNVELDVYIEMQAGHAIAELNSEPGAMIRWYDSTRTIIVPTAPANNIFLLGIYQATFNYSPLADRQVARYAQFHLVPPSNAAFMAIECTCTRVNARTAVVGVGGFKVYAAGTEECTEWVPAQLKWQTLAGNTAPATGTWKVGDRAANLVPAAASPAAYVCTVAGSPGTWKAEANLV